MQDPRSRIQDPGSCILGSTSCLGDPGSRILDPGSWSRWTQDPGSRSSLLRGSGEIFLRPFWEPKSPLYSPGALPWQFWLKLRLAKVVTRLLLGFFETWPLSSASYRYRTSIHGGRATHWLAQTLLWLGFAVACTSAFVVAF